MLLLCILPVTFPLHSAKMLVTITLPIQQLSVASTARGGAEVLFVPWVKKENLLEEKVKMVTLITVE